jgi:DNA-binding NarL/FixJ family response regulator
MTEGRNAAAYTQRRERAGPVSGTMATVNSRPFGTVLVGRNNLFMERIARILDNTEFRVIARATDVDGLVASEPEQQNTVLLLLDASHGVESAVPQVRAFRGLHAEARIVAFTRAVWEPDMALLLQAGADACFAEDIAEAILLKSLVGLLMLGEAPISATVVSEPPEAETRSPKQPIASRMRLSSPGNKSDPQASE